MTDVHSALNEIHIHTSPPKAYRTSQKRVERTEEPEDGECHEMLLSGTVLLLQP